VLLLKTLGGLRIIAGDDSVAGPATQRRRLALLALIAAHGTRGLSRDKVLGYLWPDAEPERARAALAQALYGIRKDLGAADPFGTAAADLRLDRDQLDSDVCRFRDALTDGRFEAAVALYDGPFLDGFHLSEAPEFERWADSERTQLEHDYARALERLAQRDGTRGDHVAAAGWWRRLAAADPMSARVALGLMRSLADAGDRAGALQHARIYEALVRGELEADPDAAVLDLAEELRRASGPTPARPTEPTGVLVPASPSAPAAGASSSPLAEPLSSRPPTRPPSPRLPLRPRRLIAGGVVLALISVLVVLLAPSGSTPALPALTAGSPPLPAEPAAEPPVLAVGAFAEHREVAGAAGPATPVAEMLATNLARSPGLHVVSSARMHELLADADTSDFANAMLTAARRAGAAELVDGVIFRRADGRLRLDLRRTDLATGQVRSAHTVEGVDLFDLVELGTRELVTGLGLTAPSGSLATVSTGSIVAYRLYEEGVRAYYRGETTGAGQLFDAALREDSAFAMAAYYAALAAPDRASRFARMQRALALSRRASERERLLIAGEWANLNEDPARRAMAETLAIRYPADPESQLRYAHALVWSGEFLAALPHLARVIALDSASFRESRPRCLACEATMMTAGVYRMADSLERAEAVTQWWVERQPAAADAWHERSAVLQALGRYDDALAAEQTAAALDPRRRHAFNRALIYLRAGDFSRADETLRREILSDAAEVRSSALWWLTTSLRMQGRLREALETAREHRAGGPLPPDSRGAAPYEALTQAQVLLEAGRPREAVALLDSVSLLMWPDELPSRTARHRAWSLALAASAAYEARDVARLDRLADTLRVLGPRSAYARDTYLHHHARGLAALARGQADLAAAELRQALFSPVVGHTRSSLYLAEALIRGGRPADAVPPLRAALRGPMDGANFAVTRTDLHEMLARAFDAAGVGDSAAAHWRPVVAAWAHADPELHERRRYAEGRLRAAERSAPPR
jgi:DNA-binding SARP family transcriptional activator/TolB-like protein